MLADDVYREQLSGAITALEQWVVETRDVASIEVANTDSYWRMIVAPHAQRCCPIEILFDQNQRFSLALGTEIYENRPVDRCDFFPMLARAVREGRVERIETRNAMTDALETIEMRVLLEDGWAWVGERRIGARAPRKIETQGIARVERYLPYRR